MNRNDLGSLFFPDIGYSYLSNKRSTTLSFFAFLRVPTQLCRISALLSVCYMDIFYIKVYVKRDAESDFGIQIDIE